MKESKIFHQLFLILIVVAVFFVARDDIFDLYKNSSLFRGSKEEVIKANVIEESKILDFSKLVKNSGTLVFNNILNTKNNVILSQNNIIELTNKEREINGDLPRLKENSKLNFSAEKKLQDMFVKQYFEHISPSGVGVADLGNEISYEYIIIGENLAMGNFTSDKDLIDAWMKSEGHKANILNKNFTEIGVAIDKGIFNGKETFVAVQHFALPQSACPEINGVLREVIKYNQGQIKEYEQELALRLDNINLKKVFEGMTINEQIDKYNTKVIIFNKLIDETKEKIIEYNNQINNYNACLLERS